MVVPFEDLAGAYDWLNRHINYERNLGGVDYSERAFDLIHFAQRLDDLGSPQKGLRTIHVAGTRGKGSATLALEALLRASGLRTVAFTSPHIHEYRERIRIDGQVLAPEAFVEGLGRIARVKPATASATVYFKTVFENLTALCFLAARAAGVDWVVLETGLGGRLDATNVIAPGPVLLTRIGLEHTQLLGDSLEAIAREKAAILKPGGWGVTGPQGDGGEASDVFRKRAAEVGARLDRATDLCPILQCESHAAGQRLEIGFEGRILRIETPALGAFLGENLQNALAVLARLRQEGQVPRAGDFELQEALESLVLPGRLQRIGSIPEIYVDGAHCPISAAALADSMSRHFKDQEAGLLVGMMADKDHDAFFRGLAGWRGWRRIGCYDGELPRSAPVGQLALAARRYFSSVETFAGLDAALQWCAADAEKGTRWIATGSLLSVGRIIQWVNEHGGARPQTSAAAQVKQG